MWPVWLCTLQPAECQVKVLGARGITKPHQHIDFADSVETPLDSCQCVLCQRRLKIALNDTAAGGQCNEIAALTPVDKVTDVCIICFNGVGSICTFKSVYEVLPL